MPSSTEVKVTGSLLTPGRIGFTILVLSLIAMFGVSSCNSTDEAARPTSPVAKVNPGRSSVPAPPALVSLPPELLNAQLKSVSGAPIRLSDYSGKVLLINIWATWCGPCRNEIPELVKFYRQYKDQGLEVVGLSTENPDASAERVREFVQSFDIDYRVGWATADVAVTLMQGRDSIPQSFIISRDGKILKRFIGFSPVGTPPQLKQAIEDALKS